MSKPAPIQKPKPLTAPRSGQRHKQITPTRLVEDEMRILKDLRSRLAEATDDDEIAIRDTIEGQVDLDGLFTALIERRNEALAEAEARKALAQRYADMSKKDEARADRIEEMLLKALHLANQKSWKTIAGMVSLRAGSWSVDVIDAGLIPLLYQKPVPDKAMIKEKLQERRRDIDSMSADAFLSYAEGFSLPHPIDPLTLDDAKRREMTLAILAQLIPGAALHQGEETVTIR